MSTPTIPARFPCPECKGIGRIKNSESLEDCLSCFSLGSISRAEMMYNLMCKYKIDIQENGGIWSSVVCIHNEPHWDNISVDGIEDPALSVILCAIKAGLLDPETWEVK